MTTSTGGRLLAHDELLRFVERFAMALAELGLPRMPARVFAYILADDADRYTAAELAGGLRVSPAAVSGAVHFLLTARLISKGREPGARADSYRVHDEDIWYTITRHRLENVEPLEQLAAEGVELLGRHTPGGRRMAETREFYAFSRRRMKAYLEEWRRQKPTLLAGPG